MELVIITWLVWSVVVWVIASSRGRIGILWFLLCFLLSPLLAMILVLALPSPRAEAQAFRGQAPGHQHAVAFSGGSHPPPQSNDTRDCPHCAETIKRAAKVCKHCGREVEPAPEPETKTCRFCGSNVPTGAATCSCGHIFDMVQIGG